MKKKVYLLAVFSSTKKYEIVQTTTGTGTIFGLYIIYNLKLRNPDPDWAKTLDPYPDPFHNHDKN
jgi:hypothetical protein